ncbi:MAG: cation:proton antiporter regulatory subunit, partial [Ignavibacteriales bacterium]
QLVWHIMYHLDIPHDDVDEYLKNSFISRFNNSSENGCFRRIQKPGLRVQEFLIPTDSVWADKTLRDSNIREKTGCNVVVLNKPDGSARMNPHSDEFIQAGDHVLCIGTPEQLKMFKSWNEGDIRE